MDHFRYVYTYDTLYMYQMIPYKCIMVSLYGIILWDFYSKSQFVAVFSWDLYGTLPKLNWQFVPERLPKPNRKVVFMAFRGEMLNFGKVSFENVGNPNWEYFVGTFCIVWEKVGNLYPNWASKKG